MVAEKMSKRCYLITGESEREARGRVMMNLNFKIKRERKRILLHERRFLPFSISICPPSESLSKARSDSKASSSSLLLHESRKGMKWKLFSTKIKFSNSHPKMSEKSSV
jgi:hypothetical protein